jgi:hypothetical protein
MKFPEVKTVSTLIFVCPKYIGCQWARKFKREKYNQKEGINQLVQYVIVRHGSFNMLRVQVRNFMDSNVNFDAVQKLQMMHIFAHAIKETFGENYARIAIAFKKYVEAAIGI